MNMNIRQHLRTSILAVALVLAAGVPGLAWGPHSRKVILYHQTDLGGTTLAVGKYSVAWKTHSPEATVKFTLHHHALLSTNGVVQKRDRTYLRNEVVYNTEGGMMSLTEIRFAGTNKALVFNQQCPTSRTLAESLKTDLAGRISGLPSARAPETR